MAVAEEKVSDLCKGFVFIWVLEIHACKVLHVGGVSSVNLDVNSPVRPGCFERVLGDELGMSPLFDGGGSLL